MYKNTDLLKEVIRHKKIKETFIYTERNKEKTKKVLKILYASIDFLFRSNANIICSN